MTTLASTGPNSTPVPQSQTVAPRTGIWKLVDNLPFLLLHLACLGVFFVSVNWLAITLCLTFYVIRMFGITAGYHRYFSHRTYKTGRFFQFVLAWLGCSALQKGPLWWAAHHRNHHKYSDTDKDPHSPIAKSVWWSHVGWVIDSSSYDCSYKDVREWTRYPELMWLNRLHWVPGICLAVLCYLVGGWSGLVWGFFVSTVLLYHGVFTVNSICHLWGSRRYQTTDQSRNNPLIAIITLGEGWHNNHHYYQTSTNQGFYWWEIDISYSVLRFLEVFGGVWKLRTPPKHRLDPNGGKKKRKTALAKPEPAKPMETAAAE